MGLCKCPKRSVTNQFCFEHRVNVCENCMVTNHPKCIVQSYLQWLKDSDYDSSCTLCRNPLDAEECIRLICYHVFHWNCINAREESLPSNTAPGGHTCPTCSSQIFPPANLISPVADVLRNRLGQVNWGRNELGLPLLSEETKEMRSTTSKSFQSNQSTTVHKSNKIMNSTYNNINNNNNNNNNINKPHSVVNMDSFKSIAAADQHANSRRPLLAREPPIGASDRDDNKYKKRSPAEIVSRWSRRLYAPSARPPWRRTWFLVLGGIILFCLIIYIMATLGRRATDNDMSLEIDNNRFVHNN